MSKLPDSCDVIKNIREDLQYVFQTWYPTDFYNADIREKYHFLSLVQTYVAEELDYMRTELEQED